VIPAHQRATEPSKEVDTVKLFAIMLITATAVAGFLAPASAQAPAQEGAIMPGKSIGPFEVGMSLERARDLMSQFGTVEAYDGPLGRGFCNPERGVGVCVFDRWSRLSVETPGTVAFIITDDARFTTVPGGHKVGQTLLDVLKTFGLYTTSQDTEILWEARGLAVDVRASRTGLTVQFIGVFTPRSVAGVWTQVL
jgi:hypothetical protein